MVDQIKSIIEQLASKEVANSSIDNSLASSVAQETGNSLFEGLTGAFQGGNLTDLMSLFNQDKSSLVSNPIVKQIITGLTSNLGSKIGIDSKQASSFATTIIPLIISFIGSKAKAGESGFNVTDLISGFGGNNSGSMLDSLGGLGLDVNGDGKVDFQDALAALSGSQSNTSAPKQGGGLLGGLLGGLFGGKK